MKRLLAIATAFCFVLPAVALSAPGDQNKGPHGKPPMTKPAFGAKPVGTPPSHSHKPRPPHHKPPNYKPRPPSWRPPGWHKPRPNHWYWRGRWVTRVHIAPFRYPSGWSYRYWTVGDVLPALFLSAMYYYDDVRPLGLEIPPPGYRWVRYGPDLLLVNLRTGSVEQVAYGVFY